MKNKSKVLEAMLLELEMRKNELPKKPLKSVYFGGGTPSLLNITEIQSFLEVCEHIFGFEKGIEITLEANPDDLHLQKIKDLASTAINRLSIGVQSFLDKDLRFMNRAHHAVEAVEVISNAKKNFNNLTVDLIYGIPNTNLKTWEDNLQKLIDLQIPHISAYALTVEEKTVLDHLIRSKKVSPLDEAAAASQFHFMVDYLTQKGYIQYELSNFGKPNFFSVNNTAYWEGKPYLGIGPSAHSFDGDTRSWNVANNTKYYKTIIESRSLPITREMLSSTNKYNEYVMTALRTHKGIDTVKVQKHFGAFFVGHIQKHSETYVRKKWLVWQEDRLCCTQEGKFFSDGIASDLFYVD